MTFKRKITDEMKAWKKSKERKALLIEGARRVGKSTIVEDFAQKNYETYKLIDFSRTSDDVKNLFDSEINDLDTFFTKLAALTTPNGTLHPHKSVIIFDEIEDFPRARDCLDRLVEDGRYDFIETGSLVSLKGSVTDIHLPVKELALKMYPMDFEEFCWALNDRKSLAQIKYIRECYNLRKALDADRHVAAKKLFEEYMIVGGMPQAVQKFKDSDKSLNNMASVEDVKKSILKLYRDDIRKYPYSDPGKIIQTFDSIPSQLSKHEQDIEKYGDSYFWLAESMVCNVCRKISDPIVGLSSTEDPDYAKCYMGDTGLLLSHIYDENTSFNSGVYKKVIDSYLHTNNGMLYENMVAQALVMSGQKLYYYSRQKNGDETNNVDDEDPDNHDIEIDFLVTQDIDYNYRITPIEVKSSDQYKTASLNRFRTKFNKNIAFSVIVHPKNLEYDVTNNILYIPHYMSFCLMQKS